MALCSLASADMTEKMVVPILGSLDVISMDEFGVSGF
jgi:hypothetical protein